VQKTLAVVIGVIGLAATLVSALGSPAGAVPGGPVGVHPASWTPSLATSGTDGSVEQVRQLVRCRGTMYAVGVFSEIRQAAPTVKTVTRNNAFSFDAQTGQITGWNPDVNGRVNSVALSKDCSTAYLGGRFTRVGTAARRNLAAVSTTTGLVRSTFRGNANREVNALLLMHGHLLVGGAFATIDGSATPYLASLKPKGGTSDGYVNLAISGNYQYVDAMGRSAAPNKTKIFNFARSPDATKVLVMGDFTSVGGQPRKQIFMADLGTARMGVDPWYSSEFDLNCNYRQPFWLRAASWSPDGSKVYTATTGYKPATGPAFNTSAPRSGLCDSAAAFPSTPSTVSHLWINYTGCDSLYATAADSSAAYFGGHERWASNPLQCDNNNSGNAVEAPGVVGLSPATGAVVDNPTRGRGVGADDMLVTGQGLWIASDNFRGTQTCGQTSAGMPARGHAGICLLPY
jgi:hypothetical protein